jgi:hypothetical protein
VVSPAGIVTLDLTHPGVLAMASVIHDLEKTNGVVTDAGSDFLRNADLISSTIRLRTTAVFGTRPVIVMSKVSRNRGQNNNLDMLGRELIQEALQFRDVVCRWDASPYTIHHEIDCDRTRLWE